jgi:hypothetical protein
MAESTVKPDGVQILGDKVLIASNIQQVTRTDDMNNEEKVLYTYNVEIMSKDEYIKEQELVMDDLTQLLIDKGVIY